MNKGNPFSTYGENLFLAIQAAIIIVLCWFYNGSKVGILEKLLAVVSFGGFIAVIYLGFFPQQIYNFMLLITLGLCTFIVISSVS